MTCHCFLQPIRGDLTSSSYTTDRWSEQEMSLLLYKPHIHTHVEKKTASYAGYFNLKFIVSIGSKVTFFLFTQRRGINFMVKRNHKAYYNQTLSRGIIRKKEKHQEYYIIQILYQLCGWKKVLQNNTSLFPNLSVIRLRVMVFVIIIIKSSSSSLLLSLSSSSLLTKAHSLGHSLCS